MRRTAIVFVSLCLTAVAAAAVDELTPVLARPIANPSPVQQTDGVWKVIYELELINVTEAPMTIESVEVRAPDRKDAVVTLTEAEIAPNMVLAGGAKSATLPPGQSGVLFVNLRFDRKDAIPKALEHSLTATTPNPKGMLPPRTTVTVAPVTVNATPPLVVGPPLRGDNWVAEASCCDSYHRRAVLPINGQRYLAQRFAIDWVQLDDQKRLASGDPKLNESYPQFGKEALAVADGVVAHVTDGMPEGTPGSFAPGATAATADGNSVVLDLGGGRYALYAHLQPGSIRVKQGDRVTRKQVLGLVGNTGNSSCPHLHFHIMDGPSPLASNGLPYVIDRFEVTGRAVSDDDLDTELNHANQPVETVAEPGSPQRTNVLPANLVIVRFPD